MMNRLAIMAALSLATLSHATRIVVNSDEWAFSEGQTSGYGGSGFANGNDGAQFALNLAGWLTEGAAGKNILVASSSFGMTGSTLQTTLTGAGYGYAQTSAGLTLAQLQGYDAVFVAAPTSVSTAVLTQYVNGGGNVYLSAGTGAICDDCTWDPFLNAFGLDLGPGYNGIGSPYTAAAMSIPVSGSHPILAGVDHLQFGNANTVFDINASDARGQVVASHNGIGLLGVYDGNPPVGAVPEPGSMALMGLGCAGLAFALRRRRA